MSIKIGIFGYGNIGKGIECAVKQNPDMELAAVFTRRDPATVKTVFGETSVVSASEVEDYADKIDVMIMCGGSATDLPKQTPYLAQYFNVVDSFDTHAKIPAHVSAVEEKANKSRKTAIVSAGWDPGMFSIARLYADSMSGTSLFMPATTITLSGP